MSEHTKVKRELKGLEKSEFLYLLNRLMLSDNELKIMQMHYINHKSMVQIAYELGYSEAGVVKAHQRILKKVSNII